MNQHLYATLLFLHTLMAIVWVGGAVAIQFFVLRQLKRGGQGLADFGQDIEWMGSKVFAPASGILLLLGIIMVLGSNGLWSFGTPFVLIGIIGWAATFITGIAFLSPTAKKLGVLIGEKGPTDPGVVALRKRIMTISRIDLLVLIVVVWAMVYKP